ncbi:hypothetical protein [Streptomyces orinoci]|uniref:Uncharacterized protein n=1 Tax=Streptomyces orinoci TaxID=67339 RepID=A0ABV3JPZ6_STRON|nr:hypothetical protein [Streptomyces orinoci]
MNDTTRIALALAIVVLIVRRRLRTRPVRETAPLIWLGVLAALGGAALTFGAKSVTLSAQYWSVRRRAATSLTLQRS